MELIQSKKRTLSQTFSKNEFEELLNNLFDKR